MNICELEARFFFENESFSTKIDAVPCEVGTIAERQPATHDTPSFLSVAPLGSRAQQGSAKTKAKRFEKTEKAEKENYSCIV